MKTCVRCWKCQFESWPNRDGFLQEHDCEVVLKAREDLEDQVDKLEEPNEEVKEEEQHEREFATEVSNVPVSLDREEIEYTQEESQQIAPETAVIENDI